MRLISKLVLSLLISVSFASIASAHCGSCGVGEKKAEKHEHKDCKHKEGEACEKHAKKHDHKEGEACDHKEEKATEKPAEKPAEQPAK